MHALASGDPYDIFEFKLMNDLHGIIYNNSGFPEIPRDHHYGLRRGYWAALSHSDAQLGKILDTIASVGAQDQTIVAITVRSTMVPLLIDSRSLIVVQSYKQEHCVAGV